MHFSMFDPNYRSPEPRLVFRPEKLRELGIPDALIEAAAKSDPLGFLPFRFCCGLDERVWYS